jgi:hypothetical protein
VPDASPINAWAANVTNNLINEVVAPEYDFDVVSLQHTLSVWDYMSGAGCTTHCVRYWLQPADS